MGIDDRQPVEGLEQPKEKKYRLDRLDTYSGKLLVVEVGDESENLIIFDEGKLEKEGKEGFIKEVMAINMGTVSSEDILRITGGKTEFTEAELMQLNLLVKKGASQALRAKVIENKKREGLKPPAWVDRMEEGMQGLKQLIQCVNGELTPEELVQILSTKL